VPRKNLTEILLRKPDGTIREYKLPSWENAHSSRLGRVKEKPQEAGAQSDSP